MNLIAPSVISEKVALTPLDNIMPRVYIRVILAFSHLDLRPDEERAHIRLALHRGLEETIKRIPLLAGNVSSAANGTGNLCVMPGKGVEFYTKDLSDNSGWSYRDLEREKFPLGRMDGSVLSPIDFFSSDAEPAVTLAQANFLDHGVLLTLCVHHAVMDISGVATVLRVWAKQTRMISTTGQSLGNNETDRSMDFLDRTRLLELSNPQSTADPIKLPQYRLVAPPPWSSENQSPPAPPLPPMVAKIFHFPMLSITRLKEASQPPQPTGNFISTNDAISAFLWRSITLARFSKCSPEKTPRISALGFAVDGRSRLEPPLPKDYLGNVNIYAYSSLPVSTMFADLNTAIPQIAAKVRTSVTETTDTRIRDIVAFIKSVPRVTDIIPGFDSFLGPDVAITNWSGTGLGDLQWGTLGQVQAVRLPKASFDGLCIVLPRCNEGLDVVLGLEEETMKRLCDDEEWNEYVEIIG
ncbi:MAG: hypothetical protein Q9219_007334 [cf. Caloplaca sp. 3 TL-2023]